MFESLVANLLNRFLGSYIENFDPKQLNIGIWSGDVKLRNLRLKSDSLDRLKLPLNVKFGHLGELTLQIPWSNLKGKPVKVIIEDLYILASPTVANEFDLDEERQKEIKVKREKLDHLSILENANLQNQELASNMNSNESFTESLVTKIVDNLQVTIKNIHVRYEDDSILTEEPYSVGLTLKELSAVSTDESWVPSFVSITQMLTRKLLTLQDLACYMNTDSTSVYDEDPDVLLAAFKESIKNDIPEDMLQYVLKPVSGRGKVTVNKAGVTEKMPHIKAELFFEEFSIDLDSQQYKDILWTASKFHWYLKTHKFRKFRPKVSVQEDSRQWFRYTAQSVLNEIHERNYKWTWDHFAKRRDQRKAYISLYKKKLLNKLTDTEEIKELDDLEIDLTYEDIKFYRSLTRNELRKENALSAVKQAQIEAGSGQTQSSGWFGGWWGGKAQTEAKSSEDMDENDLHLSEKQTEALYDAIDYNENEISNIIDLPRDAVKLEILTTLKKGGLSIRPGKGAANLAEIVFEGCKTQIYERPDSLLTNFQIQEFRIEDGTNCSLYKHAVSVKSYDDKSDPLGSETQSDHKNDPFFRVSFEKNPLDESADSKLLAKLKSMTIFYNPKLIEEVAKFFTPPKIHLDTVGAIMNAAEATVEGLTAQTRMGLEYALEEHKTINVKLDLQAPLIILPLDPNSWKSPVAILDAGHISVASKLVDKSKIEEFKAKESYSDSDWEQLNTLMYDTFNLKLQDAQFMVGPNIRDTMEQLHFDDAKDRHSLILDKLNIKFNLGISILPEVYNLARFKIGGEVPNILLHLNDFQYKAIMQIIDVAIPNFGSLEPDDSSVFNAFGNSGTEGEIEDLNASKELEPRESSPSSNNSGNNSAAAKQHMFELALKVNSVRLALSRCIDGETLEAEPFVELVGDFLSLDFYKTAFDMHVDLSLKDINILDHIERSGVPEFEKLISSNSFYTDVNEKTKELFKLDYTRTQRLVDFNNKTIEVWDQDINLDIATVKLVITRKSILSILNFILNTFTDPNAEATPADELKHNDSEDDQLAPQKINVDIQLDSIILVLNEDGVKLATLELSTADIRLFVLPESMEVEGRLGALTLHDDVNEGSPEDSMLRNLISIEGDNLAEFSYKTFDNETNTNLYNTSIEFKTGESTVTFVESSFKRVFNYLSQFQKMKSIYDAAREAAINQASSIDYSNKIKFDFSVTAPTFIFPKLVTHSNIKYDKVRLELGELYASNKFEIEDGQLKNLIKTGLRNINVKSEFNFLNDILQKSEMVRDFDLSFDVQYLEEFVEGVPSILVNGRLPEVDLKLTELQLKYLLDVSNSVTNVLDTSDVNLDDIEEDAAHANAVVKHATEKKTNHEENTGEPIQEPPKPAASSQIDPKHLKVLFNFEVPQLSLTLFNNTKGLADIKGSELSRLSLEKLGVRLKMTEDTHFESSVSVKAFSVADVRPKSDSAFKEIIPSIKSDENQFYVSILSEGRPEKKNVTVMLTVDNPKVILSLDYVFELKAFGDKVTEQPATISNMAEEDDDDEEEPKTLQTIQESDSESESEPASSMTFGYTFNVKQPSVILLEDATNPNTEAINFKIEQVLLTSQNVISLAVNGIGLFLCSMENFTDKRLRIIDDFSISFAHDSRGSSSNAFLTNIQASIDPLLLRLSLRDIRLAFRIFNRASELYAKVQGNAKEGSSEDYNFPENFKRRLSQYAPSFTSSISGTKKTRKLIANTEEDTQVIIKGEELNVSIGGMRFVLIGDVHELPVLDLNLRPFDLKAVNWSTDLSAEAHIESYVKVYNYARSAWEPLIEPWPIAIYATKGGESQPGYMVDVVSRQLAEVTVSSRTIALLSSISSLITYEGELKSREEASPYRILNETGYDIEVWNDDPAAAKDPNAADTTVVKNNESVPWAFEDWRVIRENLDTDNKRGVLGLRLLGSDYTEIRNISATGEGEDIFMMTPTINGVHNRLICDITLGQDNIKTVCIRSSVQVQNDSDVSVSVQISSESKGEPSEITIESGKCKALPIDYVYTGEVKFKPNTREGYNWSEESLYWKDLLYGGSPLTCRSTTDKTSYYFQAEASYDKDEPLGRIYPHMKIVVSAPVKITNLLPFDMNYRLYDKGTRKDWSGFVAKGKTNFVHVASLKSLLLLSVEPVSCGFGKSEFAIVNCPDSKEFTRETTMALKNGTGQNLKLSIYYPRKKESSTGLNISIYSPYVVLNRTGQNVVIGDKSNKLVSNGKSATENVIPQMFSFDSPRERKNRATLRVGDSQWSGPLSFDAIGQSNSIGLQLNGRQTEMNVALTVSEGEGMYALTKVVTIAPRYILKNNLEEDLVIVENGSTNVINVSPNEFLPLYGLHRNDNKSLLMKFASGSKTWSSPFALDDIGQIFLKIYKENVGQILVKVNVLTENGTIFIQVENAHNDWPFSIRNFSDCEFFIYQGDPNVNENGEVVKSDVQYKPIYYKVPPKSVMPYAYDYPKAVMKELIIRSHGRERVVNLSEIGNLKPFRLPPTQNEDQKIVDLNVVADGPTQSLIISNYDPSLSMYKLERTKTGGSTANSSQQNFEVIPDDENYHTRVVTRFEGFGISLINSKYHELCYLTLRGLEVRYNESDLYQNLSVKLKWIQLDNQLYGGIFPIVIYPTVVPKSGKEMNNHPSFSASVCRVKDESHGVQFIKYATVLLQEMSVEIDEDFLFALLDFVKIPGASWNEAVQDKLCDDSLDLPEPQKLNDSSDIYFEALHLQPTLMNISFMRTERVNAEDKTGNSQNALMFFFNVLTMAIGNVNEAPIKLNALFIENVRVPIPILSESIKTHYGQSFFYQLHKILGSADFIGNPVGLFNNISSGVLDIFYEPYQGFVLNDRPQELGIGIAKGGLSFLKKSIFGFSDSIAKFTGSLAKGLSVVTLDDRFQERRRLNQRRNKPKHALYGVASGANSFFESVSSGVTGIATAPMEGASEGASGFLKGIGKGLVGLPTKTAIGFFDLASNVSEGIRNTTTVFDAEGLDKVRLPRYVSYDHVLRPYSQREAQGQFWLMSIDGEAYFKETYLAHLVLPGEEKCLIVTFKKIIMFDINLLRSKWIIPFDEIKNISMESTGINIGLKKRHGPFIPIPERSSRAFLYNKIGIAVEDYNKHCQVVL